MRFLQNVTVRKVNEHIGKPHKHNPSQTGLEVQAIPHGFQPRPVFEYMCALDLNALAGYADVPFVNAMRQATPAQINLLVGRFPGKPYLEWTSTDVGQCAYLAKHAVQCNSYFLDVLNGFIAYYNGLKLAEKHAAQERDRAACLKEKSWNARVAGNKFTWSEVAGVAGDMLRAALQLW